MTPPQITHPAQARAPIVTSFDGRTYDPLFDQERLTTQLHLVWSFLQDGKWHTLHGLAHYTGGSEAGVSARLRDLRKARCGSWIIERRRASDGLWYYRLAGRKPSDGQQMLPL